MCQDSSGTLSITKQKSRAEKRHKHNHQQTDNFGRVGDDLGSSTMIHTYAENEETSAFSKFPSCPVRLIESAVCQTCIKHEAQSPSKAPARSHSEIPPPPLLLLSALMFYSYSWQLMNVSFTAVQCEPSDSSRRNMRNRTVEPNSRFGVGAASLAHALVRVDAECASFRCNDCGRHEEGRRRNPQQLLSLQNIYSYISPKLQESWKSPSLTKFQIFSVFPHGLQFSSPSLPIIIIIGGFHLT